MDADVIVVGAGLAGLAATAELADAGKRCCCSTRSPSRASAGRRSGRLGGLFLVDTPEQRRMGVKDSHELALPGLDGQRAVRPRRGPLAAPLGRGLRRLRRRREAAVAARPGPADLPGRRLGRARRRPRRRARQLGAALPPHLGHRARASSRRSSGGCARRSPRGLVTLRLPAPRRRAGRHRRHRDRRARRGPGARRHGARGERPTATRSATSSTPPRP